MKKVSAKTIIIWTVIAVAFLCVIGSPLGPMIADALVWCLKALIWCLDLLVKVLNFIKKLTGFFGQFSLVGVGK